MLSEAYDKNSCQFVGLVWRGKLPRQLILSCVRSTRWNSSEEKHHQVDLSAKYSLSLAEGEVPSRRIAALNKSCARAQYWSPVRSGWPCLIALWCSHYTEYWRLPGQEILWVPLDDRSTEVERSKSTAVLSKKKMTGGLMRFFPNDSRILDRSRDSVVLDPVEPSMEAFELNTQYWIPSIK